MSLETMNWLNTNTLIGFTEKRGNAWHYRAEEQGEQSNHYVGAVPVPDVLRRLFHWQAVEGTITATHMGEEGVITTTDANRKAIMRNDTGAILGIFKSGYLVHQFDEWLLDSVSNLLDDDLQIGSAGLLKGGAVAWVSVEVPESITTPSGVEFRPNLLAATSMDGSLATTFQRCITNVVCDNTMSAALREDSAGQSLKIRHSKYSHLKLQSAREALAIVHTVADDFTRQVEELTNTTVTDTQWQSFLNSLVPVPAEDGRGKTMADNKQAALKTLYDNDSRCNPWRGTAYGVLQTVNTFEHHVKGVQKNKRAERNMMRAVKGEIDTLDISTMKTLATILA